MLSLSLQDEFRSFMLHANPKTRRQNKTAGESVDIEGYVNKMTSNSTDGDHLTLQVSHAARLPSPHYPTFSVDRTSPYRPSCV